LSELTPNPRSTPAAGPAGGFTARPVQIAQTPVIELVGVRKIYGEGDATVEALKGVDFRALPNRLTAIVGPSGSGKSTLLNMIGGLDTPTSGEIRFGGTRINGMSEHERTKFRAANIGFVFQFLNLLPGLTCAQNVMLGGVIVGMAPREARRRAEELLGVVGLGDKIDISARKLSGGQMQRVAIARALINDAPLLLADEPTGNLDEENAEEIMALLRDRASDGRAVVLVTHNNDLAERYADDIKTVRSGVIHDGIVRARDIAAQQAVAQSALAGQVAPTAPAVPLIDPTVGTIEIEVGPVPDVEQLVDVQQTLREMTGDDPSTRLLRVEHQRATFAVPGVNRDAAVAALALHLAGGEGGVHVAEDGPRRVVLDLDRH
jgi:ABC-type lipoprotein export system ATPase subunit